MPNDFLNQFMAGWQMGQGRLESQRRNQELQMQQQRQMEMQRQAQAEAQRRAEDHQLNVEAQKVALADAKLKAKMAARDAAMSVGAEQGMQQMQASAAPGGQFTRPGAAPIPGMGELAGPPAEGTPTQPAQVQVPGVEELGVPAQQMNGIDLLKQIMARRVQEREQAQQDAYAKSAGTEAARAAYREPPRPQSVSPGGVLVGPDGKVIFTNPKAAGGGEGGDRGLTPNAESNLITKLSGQWTTSTKTARELDRQVKNMDIGLDAARRGDMAAGAQAVLVTYQKILDPTSVVRESEYARSASGQSLLAQMQGYFEKLQKGGAGVTVPELEKFARVAREMAKGSQQQLSATKERLGKVADRYGIPRELVLESDGEPAAAPGGAKTRYKFNPATGQLE